VEYCHSFRGKPDVFCGVGVRVCGAILNYEFSRGLAQNQSTVLDLEPNMVSEWKYDAEHTKF
jgi:hypothetical protein